MSDRTSKSLSDEPRAPVAVLVAYSAPGLAGSFLFSAVGLYLLKFATDVLLLAPAVMGLIFGFSRLWDALTDPLVGYMSDRTRSRWGRRRPCLMVSVVPMAFTYYAIWAPPASLNGDSLTVWMGGAVLAFYTAVTIFAVPYSALGAELSAGYHDRSRIFGAKAIGEQLGIIIAAVWLFAMEHSADPRGTAASTAVFAGVLMLAGVVWAVVVLREPQSHQGRGGRRAYTNFADVFRNRNARILLGVFFLEILGYQAFVVALPYATEYMLKTPGKTAFYLLAAITATLVSVPIWIRLSIRFDKVSVWSSALVLKVLVFAAIGIVGVGDWLLIGALTLVFGFAGGASQVLGPSLKADVIDTDEADTGERKEGTFFAAWNLVAKGGISIAIFVAGFVLESTGFKPNAEQSSEAIFGIRSLASIFPLVCHVLALLLVLRLDITESFHAEVRRRIRKRQEPAMPKTPSSTEI